MTCLKILRHATTPNTRARFLAHDTHNRHRTLTHRHNHTTTIAIADGHHK